MLVTGQETQEFTRNSKKKQDFQLPNMDGSNSFKTWGEKNHLSHVIVSSFYVNINALEKSWRYNKHLKTRCGEKLL